MNGVCLRIENRSDMLRETTFPFNVHTPDFQALFIVKTCSRPVEQALHFFSLKDLSLVLYWMTLYQRITVMIMIGV